jgi:hypothetical protein
VRQEDEEQREPKRAGYLVAEGGTAPIAEALARGRPGKCADALASLETELSGWATVR